MRVPRWSRSLGAVLTSLAVIAGLALTTAGATAATVSVTDLTPNLAPLTLTRLQVDEVTLTFTVASSAGQARRPSVVDKTTGFAFSRTTATRVSGNLTNGTWQASITLASFMRGTHRPKVRVCATKTSCVTRALSSAIVVKGRDWPTMGRIAQRPQRLGAGDVSGAVAHGRVVFSNSRDPVRGIRVRLVRNVGDTGRLVDTTDRHGEFTAPWPWTDPGHDPARLVLVSAKANGAHVDRAVLGNPSTRFKVARPKATAVASTDRRYVVRGRITPGYPVARLGHVRLQVRTSNGWRTRDSARLRPVRSKSGNPQNRARYRLSTSFSGVGNHAMRVYKPAAMCGAGHCRVAQGHSKRFSVVVGNRAYFVERRLSALGVPVGDVDGVVDARAKQAFCAWRDMTGKKASRKGLTKSLASSVLRHHALPSPRRSNGIYVNKTCQVLFQVKHHKFRRVVWVSSGQPGYETPNGTGHIFRKVKGWVESTLYPGAYMLDPMFFFPDRPGIALHGSASNSLVLPYPASHACVRVWRPQVRRIFNESPLGTKVKVYGNY